MFELEQDIEGVMKVLEEGCAKANMKANATLKRAKNAMKISYFDDSENNLRSTHPGSLTFKWLGSVYILITFFLISSGVSYFDDSENNITDYFKDK